MYRVNPQASIRLCTILACNKNYKNSSIYRCKIILLFWKFENVETIFNISQFILHVEISYIQMKISVLIIMM